jgi:hypothetical protein
MSLRGGKADEAISIKLASAFMPNWVGIAASLGSSQ